MAKCNHFHQCFGYNGPYNKTFHSPPEKNLKLLISQSKLVGHLEFEITSVACMLYFYLTVANVIFSRNLLPSFKHNMMNYPSHLGTIGACIFRIHFLANEIQLSKNLALRNSFLSL